MQAGKRNAEKYSNEILVQQCIKRRNFFYKKVKNLTADLLNSCTYTKKFLSAKNDFYIL